METWKKLRIECPYEILKIEKAKIICKGNEHGFLYVKCLLDDSIKFKHSIEASTNDIVRLYEKQSDKEEKLFEGYISKVNTKNINDVYYLEIEALSGDIILDIKKKSHSFQNKNMSYDDVIKEVLKDYGKVDFVQCSDGKKKIEKPIFQYKETDYEFLKRMASMFGEQINCDIINLDNMFYFGKPSERKYTLSDKTTYKIANDIETYKKVLAEEFKVYNIDYVYYTINSRSIFFVGDEITFKNKEFYVKEYAGEYIQGEMIFTYKLCRKNSVWQNKMHNEKLNGVSLQGKIQERRGEEVRIKLDIDGKDGEYWFRFAPPTGCIMYSMPIVNEHAMLYFSNEYEIPVVSGCVRKNGDTYSKFSNVNNRYFVTEQGNHMDILPQDIKFHRKNMYVIFNDDDGVEIRNSDDITVDSDKKIKIKGKKVRIKAESKLLVKKKSSSSILLEGDCYTEAEGVVYENGRAREAYVFNHNVVGIGGEDQ